MNLTPIKFGLLSALVALTLIWNALTVTGHGWIAWCRLANTGRVAIATITEIEPERHQGCSFTFIAGGITHRGTASGCSHLGVGAELPVTYLPADPMFVSTRDPNAVMQLEIFGPLGFSILVGLLAGWRFSQRQASRAKSMAAARRAVG